MAPRHAALVAFLASVGCSSSAPEPPTAPAAPPPMVAPAPTAGPKAAEPEPEPVAVASAAPAAAPPKCPGGMAYLPGGEFVFGPAKEKVTIQPFCLDLNEVTADDYAACVKAGKCDANFVGACEPSTYGKEGRGKQPMVCVDFKQSETYCTAQSKRLPSTEEWEWAARGGPEGRVRPWGEGDLAEQLCWSGKTKRVGPCDVGSFPAGDSPQGVKDLLGGTGEWTTSRQDATSTNRVGRGASWKDGDKALFKVDRQGGFKVTYRCGFLGIRCAMPAPK